jgi:hypothetical protein
MKTINVSVRVDREGEYVLFFWDWSLQPYLMSYAHVGQHAPCSLSYMRKCKSVHSLDAHALSLLSEWASMGLAEDRVSPRVVRRLRMPRNPSEVFV